jgi:hypothetical protein
VRCYEVFHDSPRPEVYLALELTVKRSVRNGLWYHYQQEVQDDLCGVAGADLSAGFELAYADSA